MSLLGVGVADQPYAEVSTSELVALARGDDPAAWEALLDRFGGLVGSIVRGYGLSVHDAQDAEQTVWFNLAQHLSTLHTPERVGAWLATSAHNACRRQHRIARRTAPRDPALLDLADPRSPEAIHLAAERGDMVRQAIAALREPDRTIAYLELEEPRSPARTVAARTGLRPEEVPAARRRVRRRLQRLLGEANEEKGPQHDP